MRFDRDAALRAAEKALKLGKLDQAIAEYERVIEHQPRDLAIANTLGDLYARAGRTDSAAAQYLKIADHFFNDGFLPKASATFKKILKIRPDDEQALLRLGQIAAKQGLLVDARSFFTTVAAKRRARNDDWGADDILIELADVESADPDTRITAARIVAARGEGAAAAARLRDVAVDLLERDRAQEAVDVLREAVHLVPGDRIARRQLIGLLTDLDQAAEAEVYLTRDVAAGDPVMLLMVAKAELEAGRLDEGREDLRAALAEAPAFSDVMAFMRRIAPRSPDAGYIAAEAVTDAALARRQVDDAVAAMRAFLACAPPHVTGALRLVEVCLEEALDDILPAAQAALADAYLAAGEPEPARIIAEDLAAAAPGDPDAADRLARARAACGLPSEAEQAQDDLPAEPEPEPELEPDPEPEPEPQPEPERAAQPEASLPDLAQELPAFDVYVYGQPIDPERAAEVLEPAKPEESEEEFIARLLAEEASRDSVPPPAAAAPQATSEIDLTARLDRLDDVPAAGAPSAGLDDVFDGFPERSRGEDDARAEAAFEEAELAAALGQIADAERLYAEASQSARFRFRAGAALGRLLRDEERLTDAIEWFERATEVPAPDRDAGHALLYELGDALERHGESMRALAVFMELNAEAGDYRGVAARVERLARAEIGG